MFFLSSSPRSLSSFEMRVHRTSRARRTYIRHTHTPAHLHRTRHSQAQHGRNEMNIIFLIKWNVNIRLAVEGSRATHNNGYAGCCCWMKTYGTMMEKEIHLRPGFPSSSAINVYRQRRRRRRQLIQRLLLYRRAPGILFTFCFEVLACALHFVFGMRVCALDTLARGLSFFFWKHFSSICVRSASEEEVRRHTLIKNN